MTAEQIGYWSTQGIEFGSHTRNHADLTTLDKEQLEEEIAGSACDMASLLGSRVASFAYPYGFYNQEALDCVRQTFDLAFGVNPTLAGINCLGTDPHMLRRTMVQSTDSGFDVEWRARIGFSPVTRARSRLKLRSRFQKVMRLILGRNGR